MKNLNFFKYTNYQETSYNFMLGFALSNRPHFNSVYVYLVRVPSLTSIAVAPPVHMTFDMCKNKNNNYCCVFQRFSCTHYDTFTERNMVLFFVLFFGGFRCLLFFDFVFFVAFS